MLLHTRLVFTAIILSFSGLTFAATPSAAPKAPTRAPKPLRPPAQPERVIQDKPIEIKPVGQPSPLPAPFVIRGSGDTLSIAYASPKSGVTWDKNKPFVIQLLGVDEPGVKLSPDILTSDEWAPNVASIAIKVTGKPSKPPLSIAAKASYTECDSAKKCTKRLRSWIQSVQP